MLTWDGGEWRKLRNENLLRWMRGDVDAARCLLHLSTAAELWDDVIDKDKSLTDADVNNGFAALMIHLHENKFWAMHSSRMMPIVIIGTNAWMDANELAAKQGERERALAFYIRNYCYEIASMAAYCVGGWEWLRSISLEMRLFFTHEQFGKE